MSIAWLYIVYHPRFLSARAGSECCNNNKIGKGASSYVASDEQCANWPRSHEFTPTAIRSTHAAVDAYQGYTPPRPYSAQGALLCAADLL